MKTFLRLCAIGLVAVLALAACGSDDAVPTTDETPDASVTPDATATPETDAGETGERVETFWVGPQLVDCVGVAPQTCMLIRTTVDGQAEYFYDRIDGFTHEAGTSYVLTVGVSDVENPPADASSLRYRLIEIVEATAEAAADQIDGTEWQLLGFRDGNLFDPVPDDVQITIRFADGSVNGSAGCNNFMGTYTADGATLTFSPLASTRMLCAPDVMEQEDRFLSIAGTIETAEITFDDRLVLAPASGMTLVFAPG